MEEFLKYIEESIEKYHPAFGGPICPFARPARLQGKILFVLTDDFSPSNIATLANRWCEYALHADVLILVFSRDITWVDLEYLCERVRVDQACEALEVFAGHPDSLTLVNGVYTRRDVLPNLQFNRKELLKQARTKLKLASEKVD